MKIHTHESELQTSSSGSHAGRLLIGKENGATSGFCMGVSYYALTEYGKPGIHEDQEGFYVLDGTGTARVGDQEFAVRPGSCFIANKGVPHTLKRDVDSGPVKVLWCHGAV